MSDLQIYSEPTPFFESNADKAERLAARDARSVQIPDGEISTEMLGKIARENTGAIFNTALQMIEDEEMPPSVRATLIKEIKEWGHGKPQGDTQVQVNVQNNITVEYV